MKLKNVTREFADAVCNGDPYTPTSAKIRIASRCNQRCVMCAHWRDRGPEHKTHQSASRSAVMQSISALGRMGCRKLKFTGGEALLSSQLTAYISHARASGIERVNLASNLALVTREKADDLVEAGLNSVTLSIDSPDARIHDLIRGTSGALEDTLEGIRFLRESSKRKGSRLNIGVNTVVMNVNYLSLAGLPELLRRVSATSHTLMPVQGPKNSKYRLTGEMVAEYNAKVAPVLLRHGRPLCYYWDRQAVFPYGETAQEISFATRGYYAQGHYHNSMCFAAWLHTFIDFDGKVHVCAHRGDERPAGDIEVETFEAIWNGEVYSMARQEGSPSMGSKCHRCMVFIDRNKWIEQELRAIVPT